MAALLLKTPDPTRQIVLPQTRGVEPRDLSRYPLPPRASLALVTVIIDELRRQGHAASMHVERERLVDWDETHRYDQHSYCAEDGWRRDPKAPTVLRFVAGGCDVRVNVDGRETRLTPAMLRMGGQQLRITLAGRP